MFSHAMQTKMDSRAGPNFIDPSLRGALAGLLGFLLLEVVIVMTSHRAVIPRRVGKYFVNWPAPGQV